MARSLGELFGLMSDLTRLSPKFLGRLNTSLGGSTNTFLSLGSVWTMCQCFWIVSLKAVPSGEYLTKHIEGLLLDDLFVGWRHSSWVF